MWVVAEGVGRTGLLPMTRGKTIKSKENEVVAFHGEEL